MFYFFAVPLMVYNYILVLAAVIPAIALLIWTYKADRLEKESPRLFFYRIYSDRRPKSARWQLAFRRVPSGRYSCSRIFACSIKYAVRFPLS